MLNIFEPTTFPKAISDFFLHAAVIDAVSSGNEVPHAIIVKDIIESEIPHDWASITDESTKNFEDIISSVKPPISCGIIVDNLICLLLFCVMVDVGLVSNEL